MIQMRYRDIQRRRLELDEKVAGIKSEELRRLAADMIAKGGRVFDG